MSKCPICNKKEKKLIKHHTSYQHNITIEVCKPCHYIIHKTEKYLELKPKDSSNHIIVSLTEETHKRLVQDRDHFQKAIGGGKWSLSDTIEEYYRIMPKRKWIFILGGINNEI